MLLPAMLEAAVLLKQDRPELEFYLPVATGIDRTRLESMVSEYAVEVHFTEEKTYDLMNISSFALATSGTVVMEAAIMGLPCVALYRMASLNYAIGKMLVKIESFTLPNILAGRKVQQELLQDEVTGQKVFEAARRFYAEAGYKQQVMAGLQEAVAKLGAPGAAGRVAQRIVEAARLYGSNSTLEVRE